MNNQRQRDSDVLGSSLYSSSSSSPASPGIAAATEGGAEQMSRQRLEVIDTMKAPIIQMGKNAGYEVIENYDLGAGPIHVTWLFKPAGSESLPDMRIGFICITEFSQFSLNEAIARSMINLIDKLVLVVPTEEMTKTISDSIELMPEKSEGEERSNSSSSGSILQLRKYITVVTPSTLTSKTDIKGARERQNPQTGEIL